jgi:hypothetical protein
MTFDSVLLALKRAEGVPFVGNDGEEAMVECLLPRKQHFDKIVRHRHLAVMSAPPLLALSSTLGLWAVHSYG